MAPHRRKRAKVSTFVSQDTALVNNDQWEAKFSGRAFIPISGIIAIRRLQLPNVLKDIIASYTLHNGVRSLFLERTRFVTKPTAYWRHVRKEFIIPTSLCIPKTATMHWLVNRLCTQCQLTVGAPVHPILGSPVCRTCVGLNSLQAIHIYTALHDYHLVRSDCPPGPTRTGYLYLKDVIDIAITKFGSMGAIQNIRQIRQEDQKRVQLETDERLRRNRQAKQQAQAKRKNLLLRALRHILVEGSMDTFHHPSCIAERDAYIRWGHTSTLELHKSVEVAKYLYVRSRGRSVGEYYQFIKGHYTWPQMLRYIEHVRLGYYCTRCRHSLTRHGSPWCEDCIEAT